MIAPIEQNISPVTALPGLLAVNRQAAVNQLVEEELPLLSTELETLVGQINNFATQTNQTALDVEANKDLAAQSAVVATSLANYQGIWSGSTTYTKGQNVSVGGLYYVSKVDSNLNNAVTDTNYWLPNPINNKSDKNISTYTDKSIPIDADLILLSDSVTSFEARKLTWANLKATLISSFGVLISGLTAKATPIDTDMIVIADSASSNASKKLTFANLKIVLLGSPALTGTPTAPTPTAGSNNTKIATTAYVDGKKDISYKNTAVSITSWSYSGTTITLNVASHTFVAGDYIEVSGLTATTNPANGIQLVTSVTATTIVFTLGATPTGTTGVSSATVKGYVTVNGRTSESVGVGQAWQDVTASRALNITYTNTTGKPIVVSAIGSVSTGVFNLLINGVVRNMDAINGNDYSINTCVTGVVPNNTTYSITATSVALLYWHELR